MVEVLLPGDHLAAPVDRLLEQGEDGTALIQEKHAAFGK